MASLGTLRELAERSAYARRHLLVIWNAPHHGEYRSTQDGYCMACHLTAAITTRPLPNEIDLGGELVAVDCPSIDFANLDAATDAELTRFAYHYRNGLHGSLIFPNLAPEIAAHTLETLAEYAQVLVDARGLRLSGFINEALEREARLGELYNLLPPEAKW